MGIAAEFINEGKILVLTFYSESGGGPVPPTPVDPTLNEYVDNDYVEDYFE